MFRQFWSFLAIALAISSSLNLAECQTISAVSWLYQGTAQQNNSALTFNAYDTLNLICKAYGIGIGNSLIYAISKGTTPTGIILSTAGALTIKNIRTLIYSDIDGVQKGYENFVIYSGAYNVASSAGTTVQSVLLYDYRYVNVGTLKTTDSATYVCSAAYLVYSSYTADDTTTGYFATSGSLTITVNTKSGQAHSAKTHVSRFLTYSAAIMGASKLLF